MTAVLTSPETVTVNLEWLWTIERYHAAIEAGILTEDDRVELIFGKLYLRMPVGKMHAACLSKINRLFHERYLQDYELRRENPVTLPNETEPEPDFVVAYQKDDYYASGHPTPPDILILIEVSDATLGADRTTKASAYAMAGIKEYWIVNLKSRKLELHLDPQPEDGIFTNISHHGETESFQSPFAGEVRVEDLLVEPVPEAETE